jgi:hypothetical protein
MKRLIQSVATCLAIFAFNFIAAAQPMGQGPGPGFDAMFTKFFGDVKAFSAKAEIAVKGKGLDMSMPVDFAMLDDKVRMDMDLSQMKSASFPPDMAAQLKQMGMDKMATLMDTAKKNMLMIYPSLKSYADMPMPKEQAQMLEKEPKIERAELGKETVEGHECKKCRFTVIDDKGAKRTALVWQAADLKDFPIKIQSEDQGNQVTMLYKEVKLAKPEAKVFEIPADYTKYASIMELMQGAMMKQMGVPGR